MKSGRKIVLHVIFGGFQAFCLIVLPETRRRQRLSCLATVIVCAGGRMRPRVRVHYGGPQPASDALL